MRLIIGIALYGLLSSNPLFGQTIQLNQGWTKEEREEFYFTPQGSQLIPYKWFLALEQAGDTKAFRDNANMKRYGILTAEPSERNPDGLPIGFVRDGVDAIAHTKAALPETQVARVKSAARFEVKSAYLGSQFDENLYPTEAQSWFGFTCAACHTNEIDYGDKTIRIAGGASQADLESFLRDLGSSLKATYEDNAKLKRFAEKIGRNSDGIEQFRPEVKQISDAVNRLVTRNKAKHAYGYARLDAFGAILNAVCETALNEPLNRRESNAPVSYPTLWNTPRMGYVQWGASADFPEARNVGEVLGVFGCFTVEPGPKQFDSTVRLQNLVRLERVLLDKLTSPSWPDEILPKIDREKAKRGKRLFAQNCKSCHEVRGEDGKFTLNSADRIPIRSSTISEVGTDVQVLKNLAPLNDGLVLTGVLKPLFGNQEKVPRTAVLQLAAGSILKQCALEEGVDLSTLAPRPQAPPNPKGAGYISRPLDGIWASSPYFHNGSVPNLYETLVPLSKRSKTFWVGSRKFDPIKVGMDTAVTNVGSTYVVFDKDGAPIPGNANTGHEGHGANQNEGFTETFEDGAWREFTDTERYELIEYMKWLPGDSQDTVPTIGFEKVPDDEASRIAKIVELTIKQMQNRYPEGSRILRGVHPKDHGCVTAKFEVLPTSSDKYKVGIFQPGAIYEAYIRFSNAAGVVGPDSTVVGQNPPAHGSRGMAIKLTGVKGESLLPLHGALTQDFLMVNQPSFAFANVEDYEVLSRVLEETKDKNPGKFFETQFTTGTPEAIARAQRTLEISKRIAANSVDGTKGAFEKPPASAADSVYFSAAPFMFGKDSVMKFRVTPVARSFDEPNVSDPNYLRNALIKRLKAEPVVFDFAVQVRDRTKLHLEADIENASTEWPDDFVNLARITIPMQEFDSPEQRLRCEELFFTPWHGITEHLPIGGINRLRKAVYLESSKFRNLPKEPSSSQ